MNCFNSKKAGYVRKTHGTKGELIVQLDVKITKSFFLDNWVFLHYEGMLIPFKVDYYNILDDQSIVIKLTQINNLEEAKRFLHCDFFVDHSYRWLKEAEKELVINYCLFDCNHIYIGTIKELIPIKKNPLACVVKEGNEWLIPFNKEIIEGIDHEKKQVVLKLPKNELIN